MEIQVNVPDIEPRSRQLGAKAWEIWDAKVKPQLSLGRLEQLVVDIVEMTGELQPRFQRPQLLLFAGDHGVVAEGVSSSPQEITWQQCENFARNGGAIGLLCDMNGMDLHVVDVGVAHAFPPDSHIVDKKVAWGTRNFLVEPAMDAKELEQALQAGSDMVDRMVGKGNGVIAFGEMGIGNTTSASAIMASLTGLPVDRCCGLGAGLDASGLRHKMEVVSKALARHGELTDPLDILRVFGGFEIAAITGGMLAAARARSVILVDGFIATSAAAIAIALRPYARDYMIFCHESDEGGHRHLLAHLDAIPLLSLRMRLGEGTGAAVAWPVIRQAIALYLEMESFSSAHVTDSVTLLKKRGVDLHERG